MKNKVKTLLISMSKKSVFFRTILRKVVYFKNRLLSLSQLFHKVDSNLIVFESYAGKGYNCSPKIIYEEMLNDDRFKDFKFIWFFKNPNEMEKYVKKDARTKIYKYRGKEYNKCYAQAKYWITNFSLPEYLFKKKSQIYIQCWHGSPLKSLGHDIISNTKSALNSKKEIDKRYKRYAKKIDYFLAQSEFSAKVHSSGFGFTDNTKVIVEGYPRNVSLFKYSEIEKEKIKKDLGIPVSKKVILYVPTYRDSNHQASIGYTYSVEADFDLLKEALGEEYVVLFRAHYLVANAFDFEKYKGFIYDVSKINDINDLFIISDLFITDYSSCFHDYANVNKPMIFYMYDLEEYQNETRGLSFPLNELPGEIVTTNEELVNALKDIPKYTKRTQSKLELFKKNYVYLDDINTAKRVINIIF